MCGIAICKYKETAKAFDRQIDRGTDSLGIVTNSSIKRITGSIKEYDKWFKELDKEIDSNELVLFHHRAASVGKVNLDNCHPFSGEHFLLFQNGTSKKIFEAFKKEYKEDVDSKVILRIIEDFTSKLEDIPGILDLLLEETKDKIGILIIQTYDGKTLLYSDGERESEIEIEDGFLKSVYNYAPGKKYGFKNKGWLIFNQQDGKIIENNFESLNTEKFTKPVYNTIYYTDYYGYSTKRKGTYTGGFKAGVKYSDLTPDEVDEVTHIREFIYANNYLCKTSTYREFADAYCYYNYGLDQSDFEETFQIKINNVLSYCYNYLIY